MTWTTQHTVRYECTGVERPPVSPALMAAVEAERPIMTFKLISPVVKIESPFQWYLDQLGDA